MIKYICNLCKNEIERKGIVMKVVCLNLMQNNSSAKEISLHFHEECARSLIGNIYDNPELMEGGKQ